MQFPTYVALLLVLWPMLVSKPGLPLYVAVGDAPSTPPPHEDILLAIRSVESSNGADCGKGAALTRNSGIDRLRERMEKQSENSGELRR